MNGFLHAMPGDFLIFFIFPNSNDSLLLKEDNTSVMRYIKLNDVWGFVAYVRFWKWTTSLRKRRVISHQLQLLSKEAFKMPVMMPAAFVWRLSVKVILLR